jgi:hypothetical protein
MMRNRQIFAVFLTTITRSLRMKMGVAISVSILIAIVIVIAVSMKGVPQRSSNLTSEAMLKKRTLKLPSSLYTEGGGDASSALQSMWAYYVDNSSQIDSDDTSVEIKNGCMDQLIKVYEAGSISGKFLDKTCPIKVHGAPSFGSGMVMVSHAAMKRVHELYEVDKEPDRRKKAATASYAIGHQMFTKSKRLPVRVQGLEMMKFGITELYNQSPDGSQEDADLTMAIENIESFTKKYFMKKNNLVYELKPNVGDVLNMCYDDEDVSFRIEAVLALGVIKWNPRTRGNATAVANAIEKLKKDDNSLVAKAAKVVDEFSKDDVRALGN